MAARRYLALAAELAEVIARDRRDPAGGFTVRQPEPGAKGVLARPVKQVDENVLATRLFNLLARDTGRADFHTAAEHGMRTLIALAEDDLVVPGALLANRELSREPAHVTIVGAKDDPAARALYTAARAYPTRYLRIEWLDRREGPPPSPAPTAPARRPCSAPTRSRAWSPRWMIGREPVIPTGAERSEAQWRDLVLCSRRHDQVPRLRSGRRVGFGSGGAPCRSLSCASPARPTTSTPCCPSTSAAWALACSTGSRIMRVSTA
ncbi:hypothetical protein [Reyranella sp.]|uniref:hypothetical protein n=1 Tax=Reyranella sp. TaxID=1929291 RepID=UPI003D0D2526